MHDFDQILHAYDSICRQMHPLDMAIHPGSCKSGLTLTYARLGFGFGLFPKGLGPSPLDSGSHLMDSDSDLMDSDSGLVDSLLVLQVRTPSNTDTCMQAGCQRMIYTVFERNILSQHCMQ